MQREQPLRVAVETPGANAILVKPRNGALPLAVESDNTDVLAWIAHSFTGYADVSAREGDRGDMLLRIHVSPELTRELEAADGRRASEELGTMRIRAYGHASSEGGMAIIHPANRCAAVVVPSRGGGHDLIVMRAARAMLGASLLESGAVPLHAACYAGDAGTCLIADKRKGKTTLLLGALAAGGVDIVANDKVFVRAAPAPQVEALPVAAGIRRPTVAMFPQLSALEADPVSFHWENMPKQRRHRGERRLYLRVHDLAELFACGVRPRAQLARFVSLEFDATAKTPVLDRLSSKEAALVVANGYLVDWLGHEPLWQRLIRTSYSDLRIHHLHVLSQLATSVPFYRLRHGPQTGCAQDLARYLHAVTATDCVRDAGREQDASDATPADSLE